LDLNAPSVLSFETADNAQRRLRWKERLLALASGTRLGPYEIVEPLGAGGMGEVYRARDPRLSREVAIKLISTDGATSPDRLRRFETEARAAAQLAHPNVVTVFDVGTHKGHPYLVLELLDGETLRETLHGGVPPLRQAVTWALEISRGLAAAHERGIVHRDLKPENVFLTTDGRVKVLDFGLAKLREPLVSDEADRESPTATRDTSPGVLLGTVGYMSPEQVKGQTPDPRTDVFALGAVLYEMVSGRRAFGGDTAPEVLAAILRDEPPALEALQHGVPAAVETVARRCLAKRPADRFSSARAVEAALETVLATLEPSRVSVSRAAEVRGPYPGLSSFTEADAERFFGRETEVEALWEKLRRGRLLAVIGPSGAGKSSFVRAGLVPARPSGWGAIVATPGGAPMRALAQALVEALPSDADTMKQLLGFDDPDVAFAMVKKWRETHLEALLVLDQFEELFTLNPPEVQERFAGLLGRLAREADVHVLLSMRDDFLMRCHEQEALVEVFEHLTPLGPLSEEGTRRALEEPAKREGFSFEENALVAEMLESVEGARGALPLLAFAVARLWEKRNREKKLLTRKAYEEIGGVAGALAQHAEQTLERIGTQREPVVRELFRNLVTAQWTRAVAERDQLLSALPDPEVGAQVLDSLVDARLLTSYEVKNDKRGERSEKPSSRQRIEIVHESLLRAWPRLVRWQAQDEEGAVLRDQLKQAAQLWEEKGRTPDLLWSGTAFQEFELWQGRYPGALTALEENFATAMAEQAARRKRRRRAVVAAIVAASLAVAVVTGELWRRSRVEALRAEAGKLLALAKVSLEDDSTAALAYTRASLDLHDTFEARRFALEILWRGPVARLLDLSQAARTLGLPAVPERFGGLFFSPDGRWFAGSAQAGQILLFDRDGGATRTLPVPSGPVSVLAFGPASDLLVTGGPGPSLRFWSLPDLREQRTVPIPSAISGWGFALDGQIVLYTQASAGGGWSLRMMDFADQGPQPKATAPSGEWLVGGVDSELTHTVVVRPPRDVALLSLDGTNRRQPLGELPADLHGAAVSPRGDLVAASDASGQAHVWSGNDGEWRLLRTLQGPAYSGATLTCFDQQGRWLNQAGPSGSHVLWDLEEFPDARPLILGRPGPIDQRHGNFDPSGQWLAVGNAVRTTIEFWPVASPRRRVLPGFAAAYSLAFSPDSRWLTTCPVWQPVRQWPLEAKDGEVRTLAAEGGCNWVAPHPAGHEILVGTIGEPKVLRYPSPGGAPQPLIEGWDGAMFFSVAFDPQGRRAVAVPGNAMGGIEAPESRALVSWDLASGERRTHSIAHLTDESFFGWSVVFAPDGRLYVGGQGGVRRLTLPTDPDEPVSSETIHSAGIAQFGLDRDGRQLVVCGSKKTGVMRDPHEELLLFDLASGTSRPITTHGRRLSRALLSPSGRAVVTGDHDGVVRVGPTSGEEPHLLLGQKGPVTSLAMSPDERWIASSTDESISIWPMPDVTQPPLHTLPHEVLMAKLDALTNLRVVRDPSSPTGWGEELGPFPGWRDVPSW
jgi:serine/threonine protein kinase/WD40 repeat protein